MTADWIERLLADPDAPIDTIMRAVRSEVIGPGASHDIVLNVSYMVISPSR
jgi:hypothetical protein